MHPASTHRHPELSSVALRAACGRASSFSAPTDKPSSSCSRGLWLRVRVCVRVCFFERDSTIHARPMSAAALATTAMSHGWRWMLVGEGARPSADAQPLIVSSRTPSHPPLVIVGAGRAAPRAKRLGNCPQAHPSSSNHRGNCQRRPAPLQPTAHGAPAASHVKFGIPLRSANDTRRCCRSLALPCRPTARGRRWPPGWLAAGIAGRARHEQSLPGLQSPLTTHSPLVVGCWRAGRRVSPALARHQDPDAGRARMAAVVTSTPARQVYSTLARCRYRPGAQPCEVTPAPMPRQPAAGLCGLGPSDM